jgi:hypothetical protein
VYCGEVQMYIGLYFNVYGVSFYTAPEYICTWSEYIYFRVYLSIPKKQEDSQETFGEPRFRIPLEISRTGGKKKEKKE